MRIPLGICSRQENIRQSHWLAFEFKVVLVTSDIFNIDFCFEQFYSFSIILIIKLKRQFFILFDLLIDNYLTFYLRLKSGLKFTCTIIMLLTSIFVNFNVPWCLKRFNRMAFYLNVNVLCCA